MIELYSRGIKLDDLQFITDELKEGARAGHYAKELLDPVSFNGLVGGLRKTISMIESGTEMADYIYILAELHTDKPVGYIWFQTQAAPNGFLFLEIKAFGVAAKFRGAGIASQFLSEFLHLFAKHPLEARCFSSSSQMADMLKRRGFTLDTVLPSGTQVLIKRPLL